jgi:glycosyltransferase involved in cell wall biosynthesis
MRPEAAHFQTAHLTPEELLFFLHIPKAAGTAFYDLLACHFAPPEIGNWSDDDLDAAYHSGTKLPLGTARLMRGHVDTTIQRVLPRRAKFVTMLRHPIERVISHFDYLRRVLHPGHEAVQNMTLAEFLDYEPGSFLARNYDARMLAGLTYGGSLHSYEDPSLLELAKESLAGFAFFGIAERYEDSIRLLDKSFSWRASPAQQVRNAAHVKLQNLDQETVRRVEDANRVSLELYQWAGDLFEARFRQLLSSLHRTRTSFEVEYLTERFAGTVAHSKGEFDANLARMGENKPVENPDGALVGNIREAPLISVITPTHDHESVIDHCIRSVLNQTYPKWEMIVVDDGSTDGTADLVSKFKDSRIKLIRQENKGIRRLSETYNTGLALATGEVTAILEGDDFWPPDKLQIQAPDFLNPAVVLSSGITAIYRDGEIEGQTPASVPEARFGLNRPVGRAALSLMQPDNLTFTFPVSTMLRTDTLRKVGGFLQPSYLPLVDFPTFLRISIEGEFRFHDRVLGFWRRHGSSVTQGNLSSILENAYRYGFEFLGQHRAEVPATDEELDHLEDVWDEVACMRCILRGRLLAREHRWTSATRAFGEALRYRHSARTAGIVAAARMLCMLRLPVEPIYRKLSGVELDPAITLSTGDRTVSISDMERPRVVGRWRASCKMPAR